MESTNYIISELEQVVLLFPKIRVRYEYDKSSRVHVVEVVPNELYHLDEAYIKWESDLDDKFAEKFPGELIGFITSDSYVGIKKPTFTKEGAAYKPFSVYIPSVAFNFSSRKAAFNISLQNTQNCAIKENAYDKPIPLSYECSNFSLAA